MSMLTPAERLAKAQALIEQASSAVSLAAALVRSCGHWVCTGCLRG